MVKFVAVVADAVDAFKFVQIEPKDGNRCIGENES